MRILILGATGMLGHRLFIELSRHHDVYGTTRHSQAHPLLPRARIVPSLRYRDLQDVMGVIGSVKPEVVINCVATIPQRLQDTLEMIEINAKLPNALPEFCDYYDARLIHFSTDGVFSGKRGNYTEDDTPDATDVYGMSKRLGEISGQKHVLTLRCCPIGREIGAKKSLAEWFLAQTGTINGYAKSWFNGLTAHEIARILNEEILPNGDLHGLYHVSSEPISKYHLLNLLKQYYDHNIEIERDERVVIDRTLDSLRFRQMTEYVPDSWERMLQVMAADNALYEGEHAHG